MQCGERLNTETAAGAPGAAAAGYQPAPGGGGWRALAIGAGLIAVLVVAGAGSAVFLGLLGGPPAGPTPTPFAAASPSAGPSPSEAPTSVADSPTPSPSLAVTTSSLPPVTPPPLQTPTATPRPTKSPKPTRAPTPTPPPTPIPTPVNCLASTHANRSRTLTTEFPQRTIPSGFAWCVHDVTFTNTSLSGATGTLKLFLENEEFIGPPGDYGMARIGWLEAKIDFDFQAGPEYHAEISYPFPYEALPGETIVSFEIVNCGTNGTCGGSVTIEFERVGEPPSP